MKRLYACVEPFFLIAYAIKDKDCLKFKQIKQVFIGSNSYGISIRLYLNNGCLSKLLV